MRSGPGGLSRRLRGLRCTLFDGRTRPLYTNRPSLRHARSLTPPAPFGQRGSAERLHYSNFTQRGHERNIESASSSTTRASRASWPGSGWALSREGWWGSFASGACYQRND